jgi:hypothetical protein
MADVSLRGLRKSYPTPGGDLVILRDIDLTLSRGEAQPRVRGEKTTFTPTDEARYMNRRVSLRIF